MISSATALAILAVQQPAPSSMTAAAASGGPGWLMSVNLIVWAGIFLFLLRLERRLGDGRTKERQR